MACIVTLMGALLLAGLTAGLPVNTASDNATTVSEGLVLSGLIFAENLLLGCRQPTMLPEVAGISKRDCRSNDINSQYKALMDALDKVLRLYDLQEKLQENYNASVETATMQFVVDSVLNQTCNWVRCLEVCVCTKCTFCFSAQIESLGVRYSGSSEVFSCTSRTNSSAQIKKLKALVSTYQLVNTARATAEGLVASNSHIHILPDWLQESGVRPPLSELLTDTGYSIHLTDLPCDSVVKCMS